MDGQEQKIHPSQIWIEKKRHIQVKHGWKKKTHPSEWNMDKKKEVKETWKLSKQRSSCKLLRCPDASRLTRDRGERTIALLHSEGGRASELCVLFALRSIFAIRVLTSLLAKQREMIGVGRSKQNLNVVDRPLGKGKTEVQFFFSPLFFWLPVLLFFLQRNKKLNLVSFFVQAVFLGFEGVFGFYFSLIDLLIISWT